MIMFCNLYTEKEKYDIVKSAHAVTSIKQLPL